MKSFLIVICLFILSCSSEQAVYEYSDYLSDVYLYENSTHQIIENDTLTILYSFVGNKVTQQHGGTISMNVHVYKNDKTIGDPIQIICFENDSLLFETFMEEVNYPISIITPSVFRVEFDMKLNSKYRFNIESLNESFQEIKLDFSYPYRRF